MKKLFSIFALVLLSLTLVACGDKDLTQECDTTKCTGNNNGGNVESDFADYDDGVYFAYADEFASSYRYFVVLEINDGKLTYAAWDGYHQDMGKSGIKGYSKHTGDYLGLYGMDRNNTNGKWYIQADRVVQHLISTQSLDVTFNDQGKSDVVAGATIHFVEFYDLVEQALENGPVEAGTLNLKNGFYYVESEPNDKGDITMFTAFVVNSRIVLADINVGLGTPKVVEDKTYLTKDSAGIHYGMSKDDRNMEWDYQAARLENYILENQDFEINIDGDGKTDSVAGVTIKVGDYYAIWSNFLDAAKK